MRRLLDLVNLHAALGRALNLLQSPLLLVARLYVSWQFLKSGWLKVTSWETTLYLFRDEYHVPLLPPEIAAVVGSFGELFFPALLVFGLFGRAAALGAFAVNAMAVISYRQVLLADGYEAALAQHVLWGTLLLGLAAFGPGRIALDAWLEKLAARRRPPLQAGGRDGSVVAATSVQQA
jgi:putative oxidoreductase